MAERTYMNGPRPYHPLSDVAETALHLSRAARRFANDKANVGEVEEAVRYWRDAVSKTAAPPPSALAPPPEGICDHEWHTDRHPRVSACVRWEPITPAPAASPSVERELREALGELLDAEESENALRWKTARRHARALAGKERS